MGPRVKYFAYGADMDSQSIAKVAPSARFLEPARVRGYRLAFVPRGAAGQPTGVAIATPSPHMTIWGAVYELNPADLQLLAKGRAGQPRAIEVWPWKGDMHNVLALAIVSVEDERPPESHDLEVILTGARSRALPEYYQAFLESLGEEPANGFRAGFLVTGHVQATKPPGIGLLRIAKQVAADLEVDDLAVVTYRTRAALVEVERLDDSSIDSRECQLNQNVRVALGILGRETYGSNVGIEPVRGRIRRFPFINPRPLALPLYRPSMMDSEKNICVLHEQNIPLLGLDVGQHVKLYAATRDPKGTFELRACSLRVFSGVADEVWRGPERLAYPQVEEVYVDAYGRRKLGLERNTQGAPLIVTADVPRLFVTRAIFYGVTLFLTLIALSPLRGVVGRGGALAVAFAITCVISVLDLRGRVEY